MCKIKNGVYAFLIIAISFNVRCFSMVPETGHEKVVLTTDRSLYITGEQINFYAIISDGDDLNSSVKSKIFYCEIITPDGTKIAGSKFLINNSSAQGCINIPDNLLTGTYYLRAYTKTMRNFGPQSYWYNQFRIINPSRSELLDIAKIYDSSSNQVIQSPSKEVANVFSVSSDKTVYAPHDTISITVEPGNAYKNVIKSFCLSVVPQYTYLSSAIIQSDKAAVSDKTDYSPENKGLSISGKLTGANSGTPVIDKKVNLSIIGEGSDFMAVRTDKKGRFFFGLPDYNGSRDLFLCAEKIDSLKVKIWIDNDFNTSSFQLPSPAFNLTEHERRAVQNLALNVQINSHFQSDSLLEKTNVKAENIAFYGKPSAVIYIDKYVQLPTLEEYFNELHSLVRVRKQKGQPHFAVLGTYAVLFNDPLVMIDWVAVDEPSKILAISPQNISHFEVVNEDYVKGGQTYGGIISIISKKGDFAGVDLPSAGIFINYQFLSKNDCDKNTYDGDPNHPDTRNTILWKPGITFHNFDNKKFSLTAPDTPGIYNVVVEGITPKGEIVTFTSDFEVKK